MNHQYIQECIVNCNMAFLSIPDSNYYIPVVLLGRQFVLLVCRVLQLQLQLVVNDEQLVLEGSMFGMLLELEWDIGDIHMIDNSHIDHNNIDSDKPSEKWIILGSGPVLDQFGPSWVKDLIGTNWVHVTLKYEL